jgi:hypothetical protein
LITLIFLVILASEKKEYIQNTDFIEFREERRGNE